MDRITELSRKIVLLRERLQKASEQLMTEIFGRSEHAVSVSSHVKSEHVRKRRRRMSPAQREAVSLRMKKYWAARRKASK